jgi:hypothetical protein
METTSKNYKIKFQGWHDVTLTGNILTGDTYNISEWIKKYLGGKWNAAQKGWMVDLAAVEKRTAENGTTLMVK